MVQGLFTPPSWSIVQTHG